MPSANIPWSYVTDMSERQTNPGHVVDLDEGLAGLWVFADQHERDVQQDQDRRVIVVCEAKGMLHLIARVAHQYSARVQSSGGADGIKPKYDLAHEIAESGTDHVIFYVSDYDPAGIVMEHALRDDVVAFCAEMNPGVDVEVRRVALTEEQILAERLATHPRKKSDERTEHWIGIDGDLDIAAEVDAMPPQMLMDLLDAEFRSVLDMEIVEHHRRMQKSERKEFRAKLRTVMPDGWTEPE